MRPTIEDETRCVVDGVEYHAVTNMRPGRCTGCAFDDSALCLHTANKAGPCTQSVRADRTDVIWVRAE